jgi:hypothetical protein
MMFVECPLCHRFFYWETPFKVAGINKFVFEAEWIFLENECPLNQQSLTKKHTRVELVGRKLPE